MLEVTEFLQITNKLRLRSATAIIIQLQSTER